MRIGYLRSNFQALRIIIIMGRKGLSVDISLKQMRPLLINVTFPNQGMLYVMHVVIAQG